MQIKLHFTVKTVEQSNGAEIQFFQFFRKKSEKNPPFSPKFIFLGKERPLRRREEDAVARHRLDL